MYYLQVSLSVLSGIRHANRRPRIRRVKCDEEKPYCRRCLSTGRTCDGYALPQKPCQRRNILTVYVPPPQKQLVPYPGSIEIDFYHRNIASKLSGYFDSDFWSTLVLQLSQSEITIRHAVSAISAIHRDMQFSPSTSPSVDVPTNPLALHECTAAMRSLTSRIKADPTSSLIPLVACLLFTCLEFLRGSVDSAMVHMLSGFKILKACRYSAYAEDGQAPQTQWQDRLAIEKHVVPVFSRLNLLCLLFGHALPPLHTTLPASSSQFTTLAEARRRLYDVMDASLRFIRAGTSKAHTFQVKDEDRVMKEVLEYELQQWQNGFEALISRIDPSQESIVEDAVNLLRIHHRVIFIWLSVSLSPDECVMDLHIADFKKILDLGTKLTSRGGRDPSASRPEIFSFEMHIIPPLYFTAIKCRVPSLRRRALDLLCRAPRREGLWNAHIAMKIAERVIEIEERGLESEQLPIESFRIHGRLMPGETARIHLVKELPGKYEELTTPASALPGRIEVCFQSKPWGIDKSWHVFKEEIIL